MKALCIRALNLTTNRAKRGSGSNVSAASAGSRLKRIAEIPTSIETFMIMSGTSWAMKGSMSAVSLLRRVSNSPVWRSP
jgi:hypothetical protein